MTQVVLVVVILLLVGGAAGVAYLMLSLGMALFEAWRTAHQRTKEFDRWRTK